MEPITSFVGVYIGSSFGALNGLFLQFDPRFEISFEDKFSFKTVTIHDHPAFLPDFFGGKVSTVTGIVGKNGVGKSTSLRYIKELFIRETSDSVVRESDVIIFVDLDVLKVYVSSKERGRVQVNNKTKFKEEIIVYNEYPKVYNRLKNLTTVFYSNSLEAINSESETANYYNISSGFLRENIGKVNRRIRNKRIRNYGGLKRFKLTELKRQLDFLRFLSEDGYGWELPFKRIEDVNLRISEITEKDFQRLEKNLLLEIRKSGADSGDQSRAMEEFRMIFSHIFSKIRKRREQHSAPSASERILENFFLYLVQFVLEEIKVQDFYSADREFLRDTLLLFEESGFENWENRSEKLGEFISSLLDRFDKEKRFEGKMSSKARANQLKRINDDLKALGEFSEFLFNSINSFENNKISIVLNARSSEFHELFDRYYNSPLDFQFLSFDWQQLSAGEESLIAFFSRLFALLHDIKTDNCLILIDEGDLYFHPEWQRDYLFYILEFLNSIQAKLKKAQIILTTHSPFLISDLPSEHIVMLHKNESGSVDIINTNEYKIATFGGNIHTLYTEAFFLGESTTSKFAKNKIKEEVIRPLEQTSTNINSSKIRQIIDKIGEPVLRTALMDRLKAIE